VACHVCSSTRAAAQMLLCDGPCERGFHMGCLRPKLRKIPVGDWFCPDCQRLIRSAFDSASAAPAPATAAAASESPAGAAASSPAEVASDPGSSPEPPLEPDTQPTKLQRAALADGTSVGPGDVVWFKWSKKEWYPALILQDEQLPQSLLQRKHKPDALPLYYYGFGNFDWKKLTPMNCRKGTLESLPPPLDLERPEEALVLRARTKSLQHQYLLQEQERYEEERRARQQKQQGAAEAGRGPLEFWYHLRSMSMLIRCLD
jgi:hypothetical protein